MSNYLAIANVTAALQQILQPAVKQAVGGATVGFNRPDAKADDKTPLVNVYLYQVTPNAAYRNAELPVRRSDGSLSHRPQAALDLHYLLTFHGDDDKFEPQLLLGAVVTTLQSQPLLSRDNIQDAMNAFGLLKTSTLAEQVERVKFTPTALSLEEFSKLWSVFFQVEYTLSTSYQASVVLMEAEGTPQEAPPVETSNLYVIPFRWPKIDRVIAQSGADDPIATGSTLRILGQQLRGADNVVLIEGQDRIPASVSETEIVLPLPADVHAGVQGLQVVQRIPMGSPLAPHRGFESNVAAFVLVPTITLTSAVTSPASTPATKITDVTLNLTPNIGVGQRALVVLNGTGVNATTSYASQAVVSAADSNQITIPIQNVPAGAYVVRVQVDGAESLLGMSGGLFATPPVTVP